MFSSIKSYQLKRKNQSLGLSEHSADERVRHYIVGFKSVMLARKVHYTMHPDPILRLERGMPINITTDVNTQLDSLGIQQTGGTVTIDVLSKLFIPKMQFSGGVVYPPNDGGFHLHEGDMADLFMLPFENNIGIILPYDMDYEDAHNIVLSCQLVEPVESMQHFRKQLKSL